MATEKICPRCGARFSCFHGSGLRCFCEDISLNDRQRQFIAENYEGCLCASCLEFVSVDGPLGAEQAKRPENE